MKRKIKKTVKLIGLLPLFEYGNFFYQKFKNKKKNTIFLNENPSVKIPPDFYLYETFGLDYHKIYFGGEDTAEWIVEHIKEFIKPSNIKVLDWGCGTGRILRHMPKFIKSSIFWGSDYNLKYIKWCSKNLSNINVVKNNLIPPLNFKANFFDFIYSISIFTHLSEEKHHLWIKELNRVSKKGAILFITTHGNAYKNKLSKKEIINFNQGKLIEHSYKVEGNRLFATYHPPIFFNNLCTSNNFKVLKHIERGIINNKPTQDIWILRKF
ncbi:class I SAM-dependent methyltransferase [Tenacibaculum halocynthiae]|uniref:class I SAM-dependent methyltransferase n=1 Tax=Tenacibaculum halocynthiae TaxID=1254437 RepID=UPI003D64588B